MEPESLGTTITATRKVRFAPKVPRRREPKPAETKIEAVDDAEAAAQTKDLLRRVTVFALSSLCSSAPVQVSFGYGGLSTSIRSYGPPKGGSSSNRSQGPVSDGCATASCTRVEKEYKEPWDYYSYYPVTLPLRRPYSGNPELLDEGEFGEALESAAYDENSTKPAVELGLMEENDETSIFFLQLPSSLPMVKLSAPAKDNEIANSLRPSKGVVPLEKACSLDKLPPGFMGKMLVYKSGAIKLKLGDILYDVSSGSDCLFAQDVVAINTEEKHCCIVGELNKRAIITPDVDSLLNSMAELG
ncbi:hypothetical protein HHK36_005913 [Tetracentron sinense]|uniref:Uncharacterized protein n=1 Tax=Tetracentron sinense TaxID=13715 RepID=A0A834ZQX7_TETSI|nr:hypothetical protein HHK36_005913 [Tetracentron sinense]